MQKFSKLTSNHMASNGQTIFKFRYSGPKVYDLSKCTYLTIFFITWKPAPNKCSFGDRRGLMEIKPRASCILHLKIPFHLHSVPIINLFCLLWKWVPVSSQMPNPRHVLYAILPYLSVTLATGDNDFLFLFTLASEDIWFTSILLPLHLKTLGPLILFSLYFPSTSDKGYSTWTQICL
jgi:hypothetical protein